MLKFRVLGYREATPKTIFLNECLSMHRLREMLPCRLLCDDIFKTEVASIEGIEQLLTAV
jgi:hypothetical protein